MMRSENPPILTNDKGCLALHCNEDWLEEYKNLTAQSRVQPEMRAYLRFIVSGATECTFDSQGRILVPQYLREHARLEREITIAGVGPHIEIWDTTLFDQELDQTKAKFDEIASVVAADRN